MKDRGPVVSVAQRSGDPGPFVFMWRMNAYARIENLLASVWRFLDSGKPNYKACEPYGAVYIGQDQPGGQMFKGDILTVLAEDDSVLYVENKRTGGTVSNVAKCLVYVSKR